MKNDNISINQERLRSLGLAIKSRRKSFKLTQKDLAMLAQVSVNLLCQIESGKHRAQIGKIMDILFALGLQFKLEDGKSRILIPKELQK